MSYEMQNSSPNILIVQFGMNDCNYWQTDNGLPRVNEDSFKANLIEIINRAKNYGVYKIVLNTNHPTTKNNKLNYAPCSYQDSNQKYNNKIREVASEIDNVILNDIEKKIFDKIKKGEQLSNFLLEDELHLSIYGHQFYHKVTLPIISQLIKDIIS
jgi:acyl-CoA thioesterase I